MAGTGRYTKSTSNYVKRTQHQLLNGGDKIYERDWTTIGGRRHFGSGKSIYYGDGNFIFTTSDMPSYHKRYGKSKIVGQFTYNDVKDAPSDNNLIRREDNEVIDDLRHFVYYGSALELIKSSLSNIAMTFPGAIVSSLHTLKYKYAYMTVNYGTILLNPFYIDMWHDDVRSSDPVEILRCFPRSWQNYTINGGDIYKYDISEFEGDYYCEDENQFKKSQKPFIHVTINEQYQLSGFKIGEHEVWTYLGDERLDIRPKQEIIDEYFKNLKGFEKVLLNRKTNPLYTNNFKSIDLLEDGYYESRKTLTFPTINDYCVDIYSDDYELFVNNLYTMAHNYDEVYTDNLLNKMTHESIKNFDKHVPREYDPSDTVDHTEGIMRMENVLHIIGRVFDDIKGNMNYIKRSTRVTYDKKENMPDALLTDQLELDGWDATSIIPIFENGEMANVALTEAFLQNYGVDWFRSLAPSATTSESVDSQFMTNFILSAKYIASSKGTADAIEMIMGMFGYGDGDFEITEEYRTVKPREYNDIVTVMFGNDERSFTLGDLAVTLNDVKTNEKVYDTDMTGIPLSTMSVEEVDDNEEYKKTTYLVPYYENGIFYDGDLCFQGNGGWFYDKDSEKDGKQNEFGWKETLSYLRVVDDINGMLTIPVRELNVGDIVYVADVTDYYTYNEGKGELKSNFFVLTGTTTTTFFDDWENIDITDVNDPYMEKALYLDSIISNSVGNNPHTGLGKYDNGETYWEYMKQPFKYAVDNNYFDDFTYNMAARNFTFDVSDAIECEKATGKVQIIAGTVAEQNVRYKGRLLKYKEYTKQGIIDAMKDKYYLNSKVIHLKNNIDNEYYKQYFKTVIMKYLTQVVPSTSIIILENFD